MRECIRESLRWIILLTVTIGGSRAEEIAFKYIITLLLRTIDVREEDNYNVI